MSTRLVYMRDTRTAAVEEFSLVALTRELEVEGALKMPSGSVGTVVATLQEGVAYIIEFTEPFAALVDVAIGDFEVLQAGSNDDRLAGRMGHRAT